MNQNRLLHRFNDLKNAYERLKESTELNISNDIIVDAVIQRFEFTFELSWKLMKAYLEYEGIEEANSPRSSIKCAFKNGLIKDGESWIDMMLDRNRTSHIYDESTALEIYSRIKSKHVKLIHEFIDKISNLV